MKGTENMSDGQGDRWPLVGGGGQTAPGNSMVNARNANRASRDSLEHGLESQGLNWATVHRFKSPERLGPFLCMLRG